MRRALYEATPVGAAGPPRCRCATAFPISARSSSRVPWHTSVRHRVPGRNGPSVVTIRFKLSRWAGGACEERTTAQRHATRQLYYTARRSDWKRRVQSHAGRYIHDLQGGTQERGCCDPPCNHASKRLYHRCSDARPLTIWRGSRPSRPIRRHRRLCWRCRSAPGILRTRFRRFRTGICRHFVPLARA